MGKAFFYILIESIIYIFGGFESACLFMLSSILVEVIIHD